jgi:predicted DNA-binding protein with PD1-like motif
MEWEVYPHLHATLSDEDCNLRGGHLSSGVISATGELVVTPLGKTLERRLFPESRLRLLVLD